MNTSSQPHHSRAADTRPVSTHEMCRSEGHGDHLPDQLPIPDCLYLLRAAPDDDHAATAVPGASAPKRTAAGCPCVCNSGGFCGGCGHAGCGGRR